MGPYSAMLPTRGIFLCASFVHSLGTTSYSGILTHLRKMKNISKKFRKKLCPPPPPSVSSSSGRARAS